MSEIYVTEGRKYPIEEAIKLLTNDFIEAENCCHQTIIDLRNAVSQLTESNRQLREELEKVQTAFRDANSAKWQARTERDQMHKALAAAKEALEYAQHRARCQYALTTDELATVKTNYDNALARIAECEKETP